MHLKYSYYLKYYLIKNYFVKHNKMILEVDEFLNNNKV